MAEFETSRFLDDEGALRRRGSDPLIEVLVHKMTKVEASMDKMADAITKLAVMEERQLSDQKAMQRVAEDMKESEKRCGYASEKTQQQIAALEQRVDRLDQAAPMQAQTSQWMMTAVWAVVAAAAMYVAKKLGIVS